MNEKHEEIINEMIKKIMTVFSDEVENYRDKIETPTDLPFIIYNVIMNCLTKVTGYIFNVDMTRSEELFYELTNTSEKIIKKYLDENKVITND